MESVPESRIILEELDLIKQQMRRNNKFGIFETRNNDRERARSISHSADVRNWVMEGEERLGNINVLNSTYQDIDDRLLHSLAGIDEVYGGVTKHKVLGGISLRLRVAPTANFDDVFERVASVLKKYR